MFFVGFFFQPSILSMAPFLRPDGLQLLPFPCGEPLTLRIEACSCPAAGMVAKGNSERDR